MPHLDRGHRWISISGLPKKKKKKIGRYDVLDLGRRNKPPGKSPRSSYMCLDHSVITTGTVCSASSGILLFPVRGHAVLASQQYGITKQPAPTIRAKKPT
jgi:hypothetical protein